MYKIYVKGRFWVIDLKRRTMRLLGPPYTVRKLTDDQMDFFRISMSQSIY